jgi:hypothetical protein
MVEEKFISFAKVIKSRLTIRSLNNPVFRAGSIAPIQNFAV